MNATCLLASLDSDHADERLQVVLNRSPDGASTISLMQQSWSESLGWYTQQVMQLSPEQVGQLRAVLGTTAAGKLTSQAPRERVSGDVDHLVCVPFAPPARRANSA